MKKIVVLVAIFSLFFACGCEKQENTNNNSSNEEKEKIATIVCTKESEEDGVKQTDTFEITSKDNIVKKVTNSTVSQVEEDFLDLAISMSQKIIESFNEVDGMDASISKAGNDSYKISLTVDYDKIDVEQAKEKLGDMFDSEDFLAEKDITVEQFKEKNLDGYECK